MIYAVVISILFPILYGCIPTTPVTTTTIAPNTTTASPDNVTTTTVSSTTVSPCCTWPLPDIGINNASPNFDVWRCNGSVMIGCSFALVNESLYNAVEVGAGNSSDSLTSFLGQTRDNLNATITCDTNSRLWSYVGTSGLFNFFTCVYVTASGQRVRAENPTVPLTG